MQFPGPFMRMRIADLKEAKKQSATLGNLFARYADCMAAQIFRRAPAMLPIRSNSAPPMAGVGGGAHRRSRYSADAGPARRHVGRWPKLLQPRAPRIQHSGIFETRRGSLYIRDIDELRGLACECNDNVRAHFDEVLAGVYPTEDELIAA